MNPLSDLRVDVMDDEIIVALPGRTILLGKLSGKSGVAVYLWCTGCRIPLHACLFTGRLALGSRCGEIDHFWQSWLSATHHCAYVGDPENLVLVMRRSGCPGLTEADVRPIGEPGGDEN